MEDKCICVHSSPSDEKRAFYNLDLHSALNELDTLNTIYPNGIDHLIEQTAQMKKKRSSNSLLCAPLCVVEMNSDFVTRCSLPKSSASSTDYESPDESLKTVLLCKNRRKLVRRKCEPYTKREQRLWMDEKVQMLEVECEPYSTIRGPHTPPGPITRQDSGNKSNPSSPVKSQNSSTYVGCSIVRSRSLDDLEISKLNLNEDGSEIATYGEIDTVSQRISKLQVS